MFVEAECKQWTYIVFLRWPLSKVINWHIIVKDGKQNIQDIHNFWVKWGDQGGDQQGM